MEFLQEASDELSTAALWYEERGVGIGSRFLDEVEDARWDYFEEQGVWDRHGRVIGRRRQRLPKKDQPGSGNEGSGNETRTSTCLEPLAGITAFPYDP
jgi:hypothetical protein